jgi:hypothetical protein
MILSARLLAQPVAPIPEAILYRAVFDRVKVHEDVADRLARDGSASASRVRGRFREEARLSAQEEASLKAVAREYTAAHAEYRAKRAQLANSRGSKPSATTVAALDAEHRAAVVQDQAVLARCIARLKQSFGESRFRAFDSYARTAIAPSVRYGPAAKAPR